VGEKRTKWESDAGSGGAGGAGMARRQAGDPGIGGYRRGAMATRYGRAEQLLGGNGDKGVNRGSE
jgi:hypothetical protein